VYCLQSAGLSIDRTKMDLFEAYAIRCPFESELSGVGEPRVVEGEAAHMASGLESVLFHCIRCCPYQML